MPLLDSYLVSGVVTGAFDSCRREAHQQVDRDDEHAMSSVGPRQVTHLCANGHCSFPVEGGYWQAESACP